MSKLPVTKSEIINWINQDALHMTHCEIVESMADLLIHNYNLDNQLTETKRKLKNTDKKLKITEIALDGACELLDEHYTWCDAGMYSDDKSIWIKRFKRDAEEKYKQLNEKKNRKGDKK